jgi:glycosyltransferase involved in cell wall biosynthesis
MQAQSLARLAKKRVAGYVTEAAPIKIAFCITDLDPGGAERALVQLVTRLDRSKWEPRVYCLSPAGSLTGALEAAEVPTVCLGMRRWWHVHVLWKLFLALRKFKPQIVQSFLFHANIVGRIAGWLARVPHRLSGIRVAEHRRASYLRLDRWTERLVQRQICVSQSVADFSVKSGCLSPQKLVVIPNGVDLALFSSAFPFDFQVLGFEEEADVWITVGRLDAQKGPFVLLEAVHKLAPLYPNLRLLWAGAGSLKQEMQEWIEARGLQHVIRLIGWREDVPSLLRASKGFILASQWEGMPNVVLEAMAAGLATITTRVEGVEEIIQNAATGWLAPIGDSVELARVWSDVLEHPELRLQVAAAGQAHVGREFSWEKMVQRYEELYQTLLKQD